jgi:nucleoside-diphosphate-sugar epimerase
MKAAPPVVVTGASGFLGSHLIAELRLQKSNTIAVTRRKTNYNTMANVEWRTLSDYSRTQVPQGATVVHLAESSDSAAYQRDPDLGNSQLKIIGALLESKFARFIYVSSAAVYGDQHSLQHQPDERPTPTSAYGRAKLACEVATLEAGGIVARPSNLYGPQMSDRNVLSQILEQKDPAKPVMVQSLGPVRDYLWIGDFIAGLVKLVRSDKSGCFNFGSGVATTVGELIGVVLAARGQTGRRIEASGFESPSSLLVDISKTCASLDWAPQIGLAAGIAQLVSSEA